MLIRARWVGPSLYDVVRGNKYVLQVRSNPFGFMRLGKSIHVTNFGMRYKTVTDFFDDWQVIDAARYNVRLPFITREHLLGDVVAFFAEKFPLFIKRLFRGCSDRHAWLNWNLAFVPRWWGSVYENTY